MNFEGTKSLMSIVCLCVLFVYMFMVFEVCNSMEMNFWISFGDGACLLLSLGWLLNEPCKSRCTRLVGVGKLMESRKSGRNNKWRSSSHYKHLSFPFKIDVRKQKCVLEWSFWTEKEECLSVLFFLLAWSYHFPLHYNLQENKRSIYVRCRD
jgi:hypothetical protein